MDRGSRQTYRKVKDDSSEPWFLGVSGDVGTHGDLVPWGPWHRGGKRPWGTVQLDRVWKQGPTEPTGQPWSEGVDGGTVPVHDGRKVPWVLGPLEAA